MNRGQARELARAEAEVREDSKGKGKKASSGGN